jgi:hypothetical protein
VDKIIAHSHLEHGVDAGEAEDHEGDQRPMAQADERRLLGIRLFLALRVLSKSETICVILT